MDSQLRVHTAVVAALAKGELEGSALLDEATSLLGFSPPPAIWRNALIDLTGQGVIKRTVIKDDDNTVLGVSFQLSENN